MKKLLLIFCIYFAMSFVALCQYNSVGYDKTSGTWNVSVNSL